MKRLLIDILLLIILPLTIPRSAWPQTAQKSKYTLDDVMEKLNEMDKKYEVRFTRLETKVEEMEKRFNERFESIDKRFESIDQRIEDLNHTMWGGFGIFAVLYTFILGIVLSIYRTVRWGKIRIPAKREIVTLKDVEKLLEPIQKQVAEIAEREKALEEKVNRQGQFK